MQSSIVNLTAYGLFWLLFGLMHSFMASETFKAPLRRLLGPLAYLERMLYNVISIIAIGAVFSFAQHNLSTEIFFQPMGVVKWLFWLVQVAGVLLLIWTLFGYDLPRFIGLRQVWAGVRKQKIAEEPLICSSIHRYIRHPMYSSLLLLIWSRPLNEIMLISNLFATIYILIGMGLEEDRLSILYGKEYDSYRKTVPALIPNPKRILSSNVKK
jgi:methanethiol S-methyltransferase